MSHVKKGLIRMGTTDTGTWSTTPRSGREPNQRRPRRHQWSILVLWPTPSPPWKRRRRLPTTATPPAPPCPFRPSQCPRTMLRTPMCPRLTMTPHEEGEMTNKHCSAQVRARELRATGRLPTISKPKRSLPAKAPDVPKAEEEGEGTPNRNQAQNRAGGPMNRGTLPTTTVEACMPIEQTRNTGHQAQGGAAGGQRH